MRARLFATSWLKLRTRFRLCAGDQGRDQGVGSALGIRTVVGVLQAHRQGVEHQAHQFEGSEALTHVGFVQNRIQAHGTAVGTVHLPRGLRRVLQRSEVVFALQPLAWIWGRFAAAPFPVSK